MASKVDIYDLINNRGNKTFRFTLQEASEGLLVLKHAPDGWDKAETTYARHELYGSVMRNTSTNELTFYKEGKQFIQNVYENRGIDANITFTVEKYNRTTYVYDSYPSANKIDLSEYEVDEISVIVQLIDTQFKEKVINRETSEVDILKTTSIGGLEVTDFGTSTITFPSTVIYNYVTYQGNSTIVLHFSEFVLSMNLGAGIGSLPEAQTPGTTINHKDGSFFKESLINRILINTGEIQGTISLGATNSSIAFFHMKRIDSSNNIVENRLIHTAINIPGIGDLNYSFTYNESFNLDAGDSLLLQGILFGGVGAALGYEVIGQTTLENYTSNLETIVTGFPYYETCLRLLQLTSDTDNPLKSDKYGRTDTPFTTYATDGEIGFVVKGIFLRNSQTYSNTIPLKFKDVFEALHARDRIGMGFEVIGGVNKVVIEDRDYFFPAQVVLDISDKLRSENISKKAVSDLYYKSLEFGYNKYLYESPEGINEFNTKSTRTTVTSSVFNDLKIVSNIRRDGQGARLILNAPSKVDDNGDADYDPSEDVKGDDEIFMFDTIRDSGFKARTNEGFDELSGVPYIDSAYNIESSPTRNLIRHGADIKMGLLHKLNTVLLWQSSEKNNGLISRLSTETLAVAESGDIAVEDVYSGGVLTDKGLNDSRCLPEIYKVKAPITTAQLVAFNENPNGLIKLSDTAYGWIALGKELKTSNKDGMMECELIRCNLAVVTPIEI